MEIRQRGRVFEIGGVPISKDVADSLGGVGPLDENIKFEWATTEGQPGIQFRRVGTKKWFEWNWVYDFGFAVAVKLGCKTDVFQALIASLQDALDGPVN